MASFDMNWIVVFNAIYEERTLTRAAEKLAMSEKTLGLILKKLRDYFADPLFIRSNAGFSATPAASDLYQKFYKTQMYLQQALTPQSANTAKNPEEKIIIAMPIHAEFAFGLIYNNTVNLFSNYAIRLQIAESPEIEVNNLRRGLTDIYISSTPFEDSSITHEVLTTFSTAPSLVIRRNHKNSEKIKNSNLKSEKFISCTQYPQLEESLSDDIQFTPDIIYRSSSIFSLLNIVEKRDMILIIPFFFTRMIEQDERFQIIHPNIENQKYKLAYANYLKRSKNKKTIQELNVLIKNEINTIKII